MTKKLKRSGSYLSMENLDIDKMNDESGSEEEDKNQGQNGKQSNND
jgi:hypothetical protein